MNHRSSRSRTALIAATAAVTGLTTAGVALVTQASASPMASMRTTVLAGDVLPGLHRATDAGAVSPGRQVLVGVIVANPHAAAEKALAKAIYTPGNPDYHRFLTPDQYAARFAVPSSTYDAVTRWATRDGLSVARSTSTRDYLTLSGTAQQAEQTFSVSLHTYRQQNGDTFYANTAAPSVPAGYGITGVIGLNSKLRSSLPATTPANSKAALQRGYVTTQSQSDQLVPAQDGCTGPACTGLTTPQDLWSVYDQPTTNYGQGQSMAVFGEGQTAPVVTNLREFEQLHGLPPVPLSVVLTDGSKAKYDDNSGEVEWDLDTQSSTGMAPQVLGEKLYFASSLSDASVLDDFEAWVEDPNGPLQANASFGECEENPVGNASESGYAFSAGVQFTEASEAAFQQAVVEGRTLFASTGDTGSSCPIVPVNVNGIGNEAYPVVNYPASSPEVVAVGGTVLYTDGTGADKTGLTPSGASRITEYSWNYTGGGTSGTFAQPDYQQKYSAPQPSAPCVENPDGTPSSGETCRGIPDIAAQSGDVASNGYAIVASGQTNYPGGGTSLSSPLSMGMWTRINAAAPAVDVSGTATYPGLGFANESYYKDYAANPGDFFDIGGDPTTSPPNSNGTYTSGPGDDYLSGLGVPDVTKVMQHVDGTTTPANNILPTYPPPAPNINPCSPTLFTDAAGDDAFIGDPNGSGSNPQLDILSGAMAVNNGNLVTTLTINDLSKNTANAGGAANEYYFLWSYKGTQYFSNAEVDTTTGAVTYGDGTVSGTTFTTANSNDTGQFNTGKNGTVVVDVPLANIGGPASGDLLQSPAGQTRVLVGTSVTGGFIEQADTGGPQYDFQLGAVCDPNSPVPSDSVPTQTVSPTPIGSAPSPPASCSPSSSPSASFTVQPTPTPSKTGTAAPAPAPAATSPSTAPTTSKPSPTCPSPSPTKSKKPSGRPNYQVRRQRATSKHPRRVVVLVRDTSSKVNRLTGVHLHHCRWSLGRAHNKRIKPARHKFRIYFVRKHAHHRGHARFVIRDRKNHFRRAHLRV